MEPEVNQEGIPQSNKQAFIYSKKPTNTNKAITRKLRQSQAPQLMDQQQNHSVGANLDNTRSSQNEAETIATQGNYNSATVSPLHGQAHSQGDYVKDNNYNRQGSDILAASDVLQRPPDNRRFHTSHRAKTSAHNQYSAYYEDNIESETEVLCDPEFETKMEMQDTQMREIDHQSNASNPKANQLQQPRTEMTQPLAPLSQEDHFKAIDAVINSGVDDRAKQRMIGEIQERYRDQQRDAGRTEPSRMYKPRNQKMYKDPADVLLNETEDKPKRRNRNKNDHLQTSVDMNPGQKLEGKGKNSKAKKQPKKNLDQSDDQKTHNNLLMPEMSELMGNPYPSKNNYLTQDEMPDSRLGQLGLNKKSKNQGDSDQEDVDDGRMPLFTPGRIRASKMNNNFLSPVNMSGPSLITPVNQGQNRARTKPKKPNSDKMAQDDSMNSIEDVDYNQILPAVKVRQKKKKQVSPSSGSGDRGRNSSLIDKASRNASQSRFSTQGLSNKPKLRATLDQGLQFKPANVSIPLKQTNFYDDSHLSNITPQQLQQWKMKNNQVNLDEFDSGKKKVPVNRHRIPAVANGPVNNGAPKQKKTNRSPSSSSHIWDIDGRRHKKPKDQPIRVITSNASLHKVDLPAITPGLPNILSPTGTYSQPAGINIKKMPLQPSFGGPKGNFLGPDGKPLMQRPSPPSELNTQSNNGPLILVDIDIKPRDPTATIHEPPIDYEPPTHDKDPNNEMPDYDCPVCLKHVPGKDTAPHSRACRTARCRFCEKEYPLKDIERHETQCNNPDLPQEIPKHEEDCNEPTLCKLCQLEFPRIEILGHEFQCQGPERKTDSPNSADIEAAYREHVEKKRIRMQRKSTGKVLIEEIVSKKSSSRVPVHKDSEKNQIETLPRPVEKKDHQSSKSSKILKKQQIDTNKSNSASIEPPASRSNASKPPLSPSIASANAIIRLESPTNENIVQDGSIQVVSQIQITDVAESAAQQDIKTPPKSKGILKSDKSSVSQYNALSSPRTQKIDGVPPALDKSKQDSSLKLKESSDEYQLHVEADNMRSELIVLENDSKSAKPQQIQNEIRSVKIRSSVDDIQTGQAPMSEDQRHVSSNQHRLNGSLFAGSREHLPKTEHVADYDDRNDSLEKGSAILQNGRYDDIDNSQVVSPPKQEERNTQGMQSRVEQSVSPDILSGTMARLNKTKSMNTASQVRFADGTNIESINLIGKQEQVMSSQLLEAHRQQEIQQVVNIHKQTNKSMETTKIKQIDAKLHSESLNIVQQTSQFTGNTRKALHGPNKILKQPTDQSTNFDFPIQEDKRVATTQGSKRQELSSKARKMHKSSFTVKSRESRGSKSRVSKGIFVPENRSNPRHSNTLNSQRSKERSKSNASKSPEVKRVMERLTHHRVKIDSKTKLLINGSEILTTQGIKGNLHSVGVGFGTGRHTSDRKLDLLKELPKPKAGYVYYPPEVPLPPKTADGPRAVKHVLEPQSPIKLESQLYHHRAPVRLDAGTQHHQPDVQSEGCDPIPKSVRSQALSAHVTMHGVNLSARTLTNMPDKESVGVSARPLSETSVREQGDQITEGRFDPHMVDTQVNTGADLMHDYFKKSMNDCAVNTTPIIFGTKKPLMVSAGFQTEPLVDEYMADPQEPPSVEVADEPQTLKTNAETGSTSSLVDLPKEEQILELIIPPTPEPSVIEDPYVDDWADSELYSYVYEMHYEKMVSKRLIIRKLNPRPDSSISQKGMTTAQKYEYNLNPENLSILSYMECDYSQSALRHKSAAYRQQDMLQDLYSRAKTTIQVLNGNMVRPDICDRVLFSHYDQVTFKNVIKLLLRAKRLYDARNESVKILKLVMEVEAMTQPTSNLCKILQEKSQDSLKRPYLEMVNSALKTLSNALTRVTIFQQEQRLFKDVFKFDKKSFCEYIIYLGKIIGGFLRLKHEPNPALQETGLLQEEHEEHESQSARYNEWVEASLKEHGALGLPDEAEIEQILRPGRRNKSLKGSRIDRALNKLHEEQRVRSERESSNLGFTISSKSRVLAQMQLKSDRLETNMSAAGATETVQKTLISDQFLERQQESATKRERIAHLNQERQKRHEDGYETPDENEIKQKYVMPRLLAQQIRYDNEMEDQVTVRNEPMTGVFGQKTLGGKHRYDEQSYSQVTGQPAESQVSSQTHLNLAQQKKPLIMTGQLDQHQQYINYGQYDFNTSSDCGKNVSLGNNYDEPLIKIPNLKGLNRNVKQQHTQSQAGLRNSARGQPSSGMQPLNIGDGLSEILGNNLHNQSQMVAPSELTVAPQGSHYIQRTDETQREIAIEEATDFTEPNEHDSNHIPLETGASLENIGVNSYEEETDNGRRISDIDQGDQMMILDRNQVTIKYQQPPAPDAPVPSQQNSSLQQESINERQ